MAAAGWLRRAAAAAAPRLPSGFPLLPPPPPAPLTESQSLVVPGLGAAVGPAMELMAVPKKKCTDFIEKSLTCTSIITTDESNFLPNASYFGLVYVYSSVKSASFHQLNMFQSWNVENCPQVCLPPFLGTDVSICHCTLVCILGLQIQEGFEEWTQSPEACSSDCPLQVLRPSQATPLLLLQRRKRKPQRIKLINVWLSPL